MVHSDAEATHSRTGRLRKSPQIVEVAGCLNDVDCFIRAAMNTGVIFSHDDLLSLDGVISQSAMETAILHGLKGHVSFTADDILAFDGIVG